MSIYKDPHSVTYDTTVVTGCTAVAADDGSTPRTSISDDGAFTHYVVKGPVSGKIHFDDRGEAAAIANKVAAGKNLTFRVNDETDTPKIVTIANIKTGGVAETYGSGAASGAVVAFVADTVSDPASV